LANEQSILAEGFVPTESAVIYAPANKLLAKLTNIRIVPIDSSQNYTIALYKLIPGVSAIFFLFNLVLDAGDWVNDDTEYVLGLGEKLLAESNRMEFVNFVINGETTQVDSQANPAITGGKP
jgi:hypothetical protein